MQSERYRMTRKEKQMSPGNFFPHEQVVGRFHGFQRCGMEFHANVVFFYREEFQCMPLYGQFLLLFSLVYLPKHF